MQLWSTGERETHFRARNINLPTQNAAGLLVFDEFELNRALGDLRRRGTRVEIQDLPFRLLVALIERPGELVTRPDLRRELWPAGEFVAFDHSINTAMNKLRTALQDSAHRPRYVETVPRHGYRFIGSVRSGTAGGTARPTARGLLERLQHYLGLVPARG